MDALKAEVNVALMAARKQLAAATPAEQHGNRT
jgi:hypothetical protein